VASCSCLTRNPRGRGDAPTVSAHLFCGIMRQPNARSASPTGARSGRAFGRIPQGARPFRCRRYVDSLRVAGVKVAAGLRKSGCPLADAAQVQAMKGLSASKPASALKRGWGHRCANLPNSLQDFGAQSTRLAILHRLFQHRNMCQHEGWQVHVDDGFSCLLSDILRGDCEDERLWIVRRFRVF
jgi:hypothetical protein